jgi:hypothetical protein
MADIFKVLPTNIPQTPDQQRVVRVYHTPQNPQGFLYAKGQALAIGTGKVAGWVWKKTATPGSYTSWVVDIQPSAASNEGGVAPNDGVQIPSNPP